MHHSSLSTGINSALRVAVDSTRTTNAIVECTFEPDYDCTIYYGTNSSYTNLVYSDTSSTMGEVASITLFQELQRETLYFFIVTAESNSQCARVRGSFQTGGYMNSGVCLTQR